MESSINLVIGQRLTVTATFSRSFRGTTPQFHTTLLKSGIFKFFQFLENYDIKIESKYRGFLTLRFVCYCEKSIVSKPTLCVVPRN